MSPGSLSRAAFLGVMACWGVFALGFLLRRRPPRSISRRKDRSSIFGILLQSAAYAAIWSVRRTPGTPLVGSTPLAAATLGGAAVLLAAASVAVTLAALRTLGAQWSLQARLTDQHRLVTEGIYAFVRHPIYTGMFGMLLSTALTISHVLVLAPAILLFALGTAIRVRSEEALLREAFGAEFERYARRVPALFPGIR